MLEGRDAAGRVVAGTAASVGGPVHVRAQDPRLGDVHALPGRLLAHRFGKRAVLRRGETFVKLASPAATRTALHRHAVLDAALTPVRGRTVDAPDLVGVVASAPGRLELRAADGVDLTEVLRGAEVDACVEAGRRTGAAVTALAASGADDLPVHDTAAEAAVLDRWVVDALAFGVAAPGLRAAADAATAALRRLPPAAPVPAHRDLHDGQVLLGRRVTLLDVDTAALADPALDVANLLAHLDLAAARGHRAAAAAVERGVLSAWDGARADRVAVLRRVARCRIAAVHAFRGMPDDVAAALLGSG